MSSEYLKKRNFADDGVVDVDGDVQTHFIRQLGQQLLLVCEGGSQDLVSVRAWKTVLTIGNARLTQHALRLPGVVVPSFDPVLDVFGDAVGGHVFDGVVHACAVVRLARRGCAHHVPHLGGREDGSG